LQHPGDEVGMLANFTSEEFRVLQRLQPTLLKAWWGHGLDGFDGMNRPEMEGVIPQAAGHRLAQRESPRANSERPGPSSWREQSKSEEDVETEVSEDGLDIAVVGEKGSPESAQELEPEARKEDFCNSTAPVQLIDAALRKWRLASTNWLETCRNKNKLNKYPFHRNWCWVGVKSQCHKNLKAHHSWANFREAAADQGGAPPLQEEPFDPLDDPELCDRPRFGESRTWSEAQQAAARKWFDRNVAVYVLNLPSDSRRWLMISERLAVLKIRAVRVLGVDMRVPGALDNAKNEGWVLDSFNFTDAQDNAYSWKHRMGSILGTVGCASAHFKVQARILADQPPLAVVFEDDSWPEDDFVERLWSLVKEELPCDWEVTSLMSRCPYGTCISRHLTRVQPDGNEPALGCRQGVNWGMHGMLYRTSSLARLRERWQETVFDEERPHCLDVDVALASISDRVGFYAVPSVQDPGFLRETDHRSARWDINMAGVTTTTRDPRLLTGPMTIGKPWDG
jgi:hypothetical protein